MTSSKPLIGISIDWAQSAIGSEACYTLRANYCAAVLDAGAQAVLLPYDVAAIPRYLAICDGFLVTGTQPGDAGAPARREFDTALITAALTADMPILGVCNGMQMIGHVLGGGLISANQNDAIDHCPFPLPNCAAHGLAIIENSLLGRIAAQTNESSHMVNSFHAEALDQSGDYQILANAPDGGVEAIESKDHAFVLGVQWHPEYRLSLLDKLIFEAFVSACSELA